MSNQINPSASDADIEDPTLEEDDLISEVPSTVIDPTTPADEEADELSEEEETTATLATHREIQEEIDAPLREDTTALNGVEGDDE